MTRDALPPEETPEALQQRIVSIVAEIDTANARLKERINTVVVLRTELASEATAVQQLLSRVHQTEAELRSRLFVQDSPPLWQAFQSAGDTLSVRRAMQESWNSFSRTVAGFARAHKGQLYVHLGWFLAILSLMLYFYSRNKQQKLFEKEDDLLRASAFFVSRPVAAALLVGLFLSVLLYPEATVTINELIILLGLIPLLRLSSGLMPLERRNAVYVLALLYGLLFVHNNMVGYLLLQRLLLLGLGVVAMALFAWVMREAWLLRESKGLYWANVALYAMPLALLVVLGAVVANLVGSVVLARVLTEGVIKTFVVAVILFTFAKVSDGVVVLLIRKRIDAGLRVVQTYARQIERWAVIAIHLVAFWVWLRAALRSFGLFQPLSAWFKGLLDEELAFGVVIIRVENLFNALLVVIFTLVAVRLLQIVLHLEVFPRVRLPRGIPNAISMVVRYTLVTLGIFLALSTLGLNLGKFGLLAGALGVGLGFGLQNIIANFVSGLILAFERPIHVGDKVEIGEVLGNVKQIGVRSSTIKTFDGSEVIVPNEHLISQQVINWTLSDTRQRIKLPVKVSFDAEPEQVLEILRNVAQEHPDVLDDPEPIPTFNGFGDYFLDFTLLYWVTGNILKTKTEVALTVYRRLKEAGIDKPRPQQDVQLRVVDANGQIIITNAKSKPRSRKTTKKN